MPDSITTALHRSFEAIFAANDGRSGHSNLVPLKQIRFGELFYLPDNPRLLLLRIRSGALNMSPDELTVVTHSQRNGGAGEIGRLDSMQQDTMVQPVAVISPLRVQEA